MTEGTITRSRALDDQLSRISDCNDTLMARMDHLSTSVHQHEELSESLQKSMVAQQTVMSEMMLKLSKLERDH